MTDLPPLPTDPADLPAWVAGLTREQQDALARELVGGSLPGRLSAAGGTRGVPGLPFPDGTNPEIELPEPPPTPSTYTVRVDVVGAKPPVWRRLAVRSDLTLDVVHRVLQAAFGWQDYHLHRFCLDDPYSSPHFVTPADIDEGETGTPEQHARLDQVLPEVGARLTYEYDFGDGWTHRLLLESVQPWLEAETRTAWCLTGRRAGPLEDSGGVAGYCQLADWVRSGFAQAQAPDNAADLSDWIPDGFDPDHFSVEETDEAIDAALQGEAATIARWVGARDELVGLLRELPPTASATAARWLTSAGLERNDAVEPLAARDATRCWRVLLQHVGSGVALTQAGYLPPAVVEAVYGDLDLANQWIGKGNREDLTLPVLRLREQAEALGLVRKARGRLTPTATARRLADDPAALLEHIAERLPIGRRDNERQAGWLCLMASAAGEGARSADGHIAAILTSMGWRAAGGGGLTAAHASDAARPTRHVLESTGGDLVYRRDDHADPAAVRLARMALIGSEPDRSSRRPAPPPTRG